MAGPRVPRIETANFEVVLPDSVRDLTDDVDVMLRAHSEQCCDCHRGYRGHMFSSGRRLRDSLSDVVRQRYLAFVSAVEGMPMFPQMCMKMMLRHDMSCFVYALRFACGYMSGLHCAIQMAKSCYCAHVYVGLEHAMPLLASSITRYIVSGEAALRAVAEAIDGDIGKDSITAVLDAQTTLVSNTYAVIDARANVHAFFRTMSGTVSPLCDCCTVKTASCRHPVSVIVSDGKEEVRHLSADTIACMLTVAERRVSALRRVVARSARRCYRTGRVVETALKQAAMVASPAYTKQTIDSLCRQRYNFNNCSYYAALHDVIKTDHRVLVEVTDASRTPAKNCETHSLAQPAPAYTVDRETRL